MATPLVVIGGWLGAGKTTLVNHLLRHAAGRRLAVLVNDFGATAIDADLIEGSAGEVLALAGGCVCCSFGADLLGTLQDVLRREPAADAVLVECSGVGLPAAVARTARLAAGVAVEGIVVVADAASVHRRAADRHVGDVVRDQLAQADLLVLNQADRLAPAAFDERLAWLGAFAPGVPVLPAVRARVDAGVVLGVRAGAAPARAGAASPLARSNAGRAAQRFVSAERRFAHRVDAAALAAALAAHPGVVRAKGIVADLDGVPSVLHVVGRRWTVEPAAAPVDAASGRVVLIGIAGRGAERAFDAVPG